jgi:hypothetical protein
MVYNYISLSTSVKQILLQNTDKFLTIVALQGNPFRGSRSLVKMLVDVYICIGLYFVFNGYADQFNTFPAYWYTGGPPVS